MSTILVYICQDYVDKKLLLPSKRYNDFYLHIPTPQISISFLIPSSSCAYLLLHKNFKYSVLRMIVFHFVFHAPLTMVPKHGKIPDSVHTILKRMQKLDLSTMENKILRCYNTMPCLHKVVYQRTHPLSIFSLFGM